MRIENGTKTFHIADDDHGFQHGDTVTLLEWSDDPINATSTRPKGFTGSDPLHFKIGFVDWNGSRAILSLLPVDEADKLRIKVAKDVTPKAKTRKKS